MSSKIYTLADFWKFFFPARNFCTVLYPFEILKRVKFGFFFVKYPHRCHFLSKMKKRFFFLKFIKVVKNVARRIFDKRLCFFYIFKSFFWSKIHFLGFFTPFFAYFCKISSQVSFFCPKWKIFFVFLSLSKL